MKKAIGFGSILFLLTVILASCAIPFSDFQTAKTVGEGKVEFSPFLSMYFGDPQYLDESEDLDLESYVLPMSLIGLNVDFGLTDQMDLRTTFSTCLYETNFGLAPKYSLLKDRIALAVPVGLVYNVDGNTMVYDEEVTPDDAVRTYYVQPTLLFTFPVNDIMDLTVSPKAVFFKVGRDWQNPKLAMNLGINLHTRNNRFSFRPEFGMATPSNEPFGPETYFHLGLGLAFKIGK